MNDDLRAWLGLMLSDMDIKQLGDQLEKINEAERQAWADLLKPF